MTSQEIERGNRIVGEFMGFRMFDKKYPRNHGIGAPEADWKDMIIQKAKYHSSWDWLMSVVEKIEAMSDNIIEKVWISIQGKTCSMWNYYDPSEVLRKAGSDTPYKIRTIGGTKIESVYKAVLQFLEWYNSQPK